MNKDRTTSVQASTVMNGKSQTHKILLGLRVKQLRQAQKLSFAELAAKTKMSVSYLNEIEKGKKYPREDKIRTLAQALGTDFESLTTTDFEEQMAPLAELLRSRFLNELPLDIFGIELTKVVEIIAGAPARVGAFISTLLELSRNYAVREEHFFFSALRSFLELHHNYFPELEQAVNRFREEYRLPDQLPLDPGVLEYLLQKVYNYKIDHSGLDQHPELKKLRSVYLPKKQILLLNSNLTSMQRSFQLGKELAFNYLALEERAYTSSIQRGRSFEEVLNHSKAIYFSVALHMPLESICSDLESFFALPKWDGKALLELMSRYDATPEMLSHRLTNVLPQFFNLKKLFFIRFSQDTRTEIFHMDKELHLHQQHHPHGNGISEHYCRRWVSISALKELRQQQQQGPPPPFIVKAQRSQYIGTEDEYLCLTIARPGYPAPHKNVSVTIGLLINQALRDRIRFFDDPAIPKADVHTTCERCNIMDCEVRAAEPSIIRKRSQYHEMQNKLKALMQ